MKRAKRAWLGARQRRILVFDRKVPTPDEDSGSACAFSYLAVLAGAGHRVVFCPLEEAAEARHRQALEALGIRIAAANGAPGEAARRLAPRADLAVIFRAPTAMAVFDAVREAAPGVKILLHTVDLHFLRMERQAELTDQAVDRLAAAEMRRAELRFIREADAVIVVSPHEQALLTDSAPRARICHLPLLREPMAARAVAPEGRRGILFVGGFQHAPNVDAVLWFVAEVWPRLRGRAASHPLVIAGSRMPDCVRALACADIVVLGHVPDLAPVYARSRLSIAPLRYGAGVKGKIVASLGAGLPTVATTVAAEGTGLEDGRTVLVADGPDEMVAAILQLIADDALWQTLSDAGLAHFEETFSVTAGRGRVLALLRELDGPRPLPGGRFD